MERDWGVPLSETLVGHLPDEGKVHHAKDGHGQQRDGVGLVEKVERNVVHRPFVNVLELVDGRRIAAGGLLMGRRVPGQRGRRRSFLHLSSISQLDDTVRNVPLVQLRFIPWSNHRG